MAGVTVGTLLSMQAGLQIVPAAWIRDSWTQRTTSRFNGHGYGLGWWIRERRGYDVYFA